MSTEVEDWSVTREGSTFTRVIVKTTTYKSRDGYATVLDDRYRTEVAEFTVPVYASATYAGEQMFRAIYWLIDQGTIEATDKTLRHLPFGTGYEITVPNGKRLRVGVVSDTTCVVHSPDGPVNTHLTYYPGWVGGSTFWGDVIDAIRRGLAVLEG